MFDRVKNFILGRETKGETQSSFASAVHRQVASDISNRPRSGTAFKAVERDSASEIKRAAIDRSILFAGVTLRSPFECQDLAEKLYQFDFMTKSGFPQWRGQDIVLNGVQTTDRRELALVYWEESSKLFATAGILFSTLGVEKGFGMEANRAAAEVAENIRIERQKDQEFLKNQKQKQEEKAQSELTRFNMKIPKFENIGLITITCKPVNGSADWLALSRSLFEQEKYKNADVSMMFQTNEGEQLYDTLRIQAALIFAKEAAKRLPEAALYADVIESYIQTRVTALSISSRYHDDSVKNELRFKIDEKICAQLGLADAKEIPESIGQHVEFVVITKIAEMGFSERLNVLKQFMSAVEKLPALFFGRKDIITETAEEIVRLESTLKSDHMANLENKLSRLVGKEIARQEREKVRPRQVNPRQEASPKQETSPVVLISIGGSSNSFLERMSSPVSSSKSPELRVEVVFHSLSLGS